VQRDALEWLAQHVKALTARDAKLQMAFYCGDYRDQYFFWESVNMLRKAVIAALVIGFGASSPRVVFFAPIAVLVVALTVHVRVQPYESLLTNAFEQGSLLVLITTALVLQSLPLKDTNPAPV
jgi:hypothetical protein